MKSYFDFIKRVHEEGDINGQDGALLFGVWVRCIFFPLADMLFRCTVAN